MVRAHEQGEEASRDPQPVEYAAGHRKDVCMLHQRAGARLFVQRPGTLLKACGRSFPFTEEAWLGSGEGTNASAEVSVELTLPSLLPSPHGCCSQELLTPPT